MKFKSSLLSTIFVVVAFISSSQTPPPKVTTTKIVVANKKTGGKYNLIDSVSRTPISEAEYDEAGKTKLGMIYLVKKSHWGIAQKNGTVLINPDTSKYRYIDEKLDSAGNIIAWMYDAKKKESLGDMVLLNKQYRQITSSAYNFIMPFKQGFYQTYERTSSQYGDILFGLISKDGKQLLNTTYKLITINNKDGLIFTWKNDTKYGLYDLTGKTILPDEYDRIEKGSLAESKYIEVTKSRKSGLIDKKGKIIVPLKYTSLSYVDYGAHSFYDVEIDDKKGILNTSGKVILNAEYNEIFSEMEDGCMFFSCSKDGKNWGWIDLTGKTILPLIYKEVVSCPGKEGLAKAQVSDSSYVFVNKAGQSMFNKKFKDASVFQGGLAPVKEKDKYGIINIKGIYVVQPAYDDIASIYNFSEYTHELYAVKKDGKWGFMNPSGQLVTTVTYDDPGEDSDGFTVSENLIAVSINNKWGFIDKSGKTVIPFNYDGVSPFSDSKAEVRIDKETFFIDKTGARKK